MEPLNAVVRFNDAGDQVEIWEGSQAPDAHARRGGQGARLQGRAGHPPPVLHGRRLRPAQRRLRGRRSGADRARGQASGQADLDARGGHRAGLFRPQSFQCLEAATDASGKVTGWKHCVVGDGGVMLLTGGMRIPYYGVPNQQLELRGVSHGVQLKHWRAVAHVFNVFAIESFVDQMAVDAEHGPDRSSGSSAWAPRPRRASASRPWRRCATGRRRVRTAARSASRSPNAPARSAPAWSKSRSTGRPARSRSTRCGSRSTAAPS